MSTGMTFRLTPHHPHVHQIVAPMTGHHTKIMSSLKLQTSYTVATRCLAAILILYSTSGQPL